MIWYMIWKECSEIIVVNFNAIVKAEFIRGCCFTCENYYIHIGCNDAFTISKCVEIFKI